MNKKTFLFALQRLLVIAVIFGLASLPASARGVEQPLRPDFAPGRILVKFKPAVSPGSAQLALAARSLHADGSISALNVLKVPVPPGQEQAVVSALLHNPNVQYAETDGIVHALDIIPNDPGFGSQWGLSKISAPQAWSGSTGSSSVTIAVIDTGIDLSHPDLTCAGKLVTGWNFISGNNVANDDMGHGTHVAGIAAACSNNNTGVAGVDWGAKLMPVKVLDSSGSGFDSDIASGITFAVDHGAKVINLSLGGPGVSSTMDLAVQYAYSHDVLVVAAAGNCAQGGLSCGGTNPIFYPAAYPQVLAVGATDSTDSWANFSEFQPYVGVSAPGVDIYSTILPGAFNISGYYGTLSGTSMATPFVAGLAALLRSNDPALTVDQVTRVIESNADDLGAPGKDNYFGYGRINAWRTLGALLGLKPAPVQVVFLADDAHGVFGAKRSVQLSTLNPNAITWTATLASPTSWLSIVPPGSGTVSKSTPPGGASFTLAATLPAAYGTYTSAVTLNGSTAAGENVAPVTIPVTMTYVPASDTIYLPYAGR